MRVICLQNQGIVSCGGVVLARMAYTRYACHGHRFQSHKTERFVVAIGEDYIGAVEQ